MPVLYDGKKIIPAPMVTISRNFEKSADGTIRGTLFNIALTGTMVAFNGSPTSSGTFWTQSGSPPSESIPADERLKSLLKKQEALRRLFSNEGRQFEIQPLDGSAPTKCNPRIGELVFEGDDPTQVSWYDQVRWTLNLETDCLFGPLLPSGEFGCSRKINELTEDWSIEFNDTPDTFRLTHNISAVGKRFYDETGTLTQPAWQNARDAVLPLLGIDVDRIRASGVLNNDPSTFSGFNHVRSENVGVTTGGYSVVETWMVASGEALEDYTVTTQSNTDDGVNRVSIEGTITGLETRDPSSFAVTRSKWDAARDMWVYVQTQLFSRAVLFGDAPVSGLPAQSSVGKNPVTGVITYSYEYDDGIGNCVSGAISESINVIDNFAGDVFASIPVLGRTAGPVLQDIGTVTETSRQLSVELVMSGVNTCDYTIAILSKPDISTLIATVKPVASQVFKQSDQESWDWKSGRYTRNITWVYQ